MSDVTLSVTLAELEALHDAVAQQTTPEAVRLEARLWAIVSELQEDYEPCCQCGELYQKADLVNETCPQCEMDAAEASRYVGEVRFQWNNR